MSISVYGTVGHLVIMQATLCDIHYTYESGRVVVTRSLGVTVSLKDRVGLHDLVFQGTLYGGANRK